MRSPITRLAIVGPKHSGKTTLSNHLVNGHGAKRGAMPWIRLSHADPLKDGAAAMLSSFLMAYFPNALRDRAAAGRGDWRGAVTRAEIDANKAAFVPLLQWLGQWVCEYVSPDADPLIEALRWRILEHAPYAIVVDDCRLPAEADALRGQGFFVLRLERSEFERATSVWQDAFDRTPEALPYAERERLANERFDAIAAHATETALEAITPDARVFCADPLEIGALAERIAEGRFPCPDSAG